MRAVVHLEGCAVAAHVKLSFGYDGDLAILALDFHRVGIFEAVLKALLVLDQISDLVKDTLSSLNLTTGYERPREVPTFADHL